MSTGSILEREFQEILHQPVISQVHQHSGHQVCNKDTGARPHATKTRSSKLTAVVGRLFLIALISFFVIKYFVLKKKIDEKDEPEDQTATTKDEIKIDPLFQRF